MASRVGRQRRGHGRGGVLVDVGHTPAFAFLAAAAVVGVLAVEVFHGVVDVFAAFQGLGEHDAGFLAFAVGLLQRELLGVARGGDGGAHRCHLRRAGVAHRHEGRAIGGLPVGFALDDGVEGVGQVVIIARVGDGGVADAASVVAASGGGEDVARDAEVIGLMEVRDEHAGAFAGRTEGVGGRALLADGDVHFAGFLEEAVEKAGEGGGGWVDGVQPGELLGGEGALGGGGGEEVLVAGFFKAAQGGGAGAGEDAVWHGSGQG